MAAKRRQGRWGSTSSERVKIVEAIVAELKEHGRSGVKDRNALLMRLVVRTGLIRAQIERAATDVVPLLKGDRSTSPRSGVKLNHPALRAPSLEVERRSTGP